MKNLTLFSVALSVVLASTVLFSCDDDDDNNNPTPAIVQYSGNFSPSDTLVVTTATGTVTATFNTITNELSYQLTWNNLTSNPGEMHLRNALLAGNNSIQPITGFSVAPTGTFSGAITLNEDQANELEAGDYYVQIHTQNYPAGELSASLLRTSQP